MFTFDKKADTFEVSTHQEEGEFFKDDFIPFSMEYFLNIIEFKFGDACDDEECDHDH
jgi:hypothetical protein